MNIFKVRWNLIGILFLLAAVVSAVVSVLLHQWLALFILVQVVLILLFWLVSGVVRRWVSKRMKYRKRQVLRGLSILIGIILVFSPLLWYTQVEPALLPDDMDQAMNVLTLGKRGGGSNSNSNSEFASSSSKINGKIGMPEMFLSMFTGDGTIDFFNMTADDFRMKWIPVEITSSGMYDATTGRKMMDFDSSNMNFSGNHEKVNQTAPSYFPFWGVQPHDYTLWDMILQRETTAHYIGSTDFHGYTLYKYRTGLFDQDIGSGFNLFSNNQSSGGSEGASSMFSGPDTTAIGSSQMEYWVEKGTSLPFYMSMNMSFGSVMPDFTRLQVQEGERIYRSNGTVWVNNKYIPAVKQKTNVIAENHRKSFLLPEDNNIAVFENWVIYYDNDTGQPLPDEYQPEREVYAVDRTTYKYVPYENSVRRGYYQLPIGHLEKKDYLMWDDVVGGTNTLHFSGVTQRYGVTTWVYDMDENDTRLDGESPVLPIPTSPGVDYMYDGWKRYYYDPSSGIMLDLFMNGTISMISAGPAGMIKVPVGSFQFNMTPDFFNLMVLIAHMYSNLLIPLSGEKVYFFGLELVLFTPEQMSGMLEILNFLYAFKYEVRYFIPIYLFMQGIIMVYRGVAHRRREKKEGIPVVSMEAKYLRGK